ncbi:helix-turn-helix domain-containing protein [Faecalibaculum rodentium]|uniref:helix-turn-helix domain-containing protein n=1 Tax=Faecalibaculum rodentium TaxID=1702221 RepID=UPI003399A6A5
MQIGLRIKQCRLNRNMTQEHVSELPDVTRQYVSGLERGVTGLLLQHSSTGAKSWIPAPTTFCWTNGQVRLGAQCPVQSVHRRAEGEDPGHHRRRRTVCETARAVKNLRPEDGGRLFYAVFAILKLYCQD